MGVLIGFTKTLSRVICVDTNVSLIHEQPDPSFSMDRRYLVTALGVEQDPSQLDDFGRVLGDIDPMLVTGGGDVNDDISIEVRLLSLVVGRCHLCVMRCSSE